MSIKLEQQRPDYKDYATLIYEIDEGVIKIPKFQRDFVWDPEITKDLIISIIG